MKDNTQVFESYSVPRAVRTLALPSMMGMLVNIVYNLADTFFVGQTGNANMVAAVSVTMPLFLLFIACGNLFGVGGCAFVSRSLGEGKTESQDHQQLLRLQCHWRWVGDDRAVFGVPQAGTVRSGCVGRHLCLRRRLSKICGHRLSFIVSSVMLGNLVRGEGAAKVSMIGSIIGQVVNIVLDPIFILNKGDKLFGLTMPFGTGQGVAGAAIATVIGNVVSVVFFLIYFLRGKSILSISPGRYRVRGGIARGVITVGLPAAINNLLMSISNMLINVFLQAYGDNAVAAMGIAMKANMLVVMLQLGLAQGVQPLVGYCYGANKLDRMRRSIRFSCVCNIVLGTVITVIYFIFTRQVVSVFIDDPAVIDYGVKMLRALMISGPVIGCMFVLNFSFQGMGKGTQSMILSLSRQGLIYFPLLIIMNKTVGLDGIIWSQAVADLVCTAMSVVMFLLVVRKLRRQHSQKTKA